MSDKHSDNQNVQNQPPEVLSLTPDELDKIVQKKIEDALKKKEIEESPKKKAATVTESMPVKIVVGKEQPEKPAQDPPEIVAYLNERVPFKAFKDNVKYKDDISVQVNGKIWLIKRGELVHIPRFVYLAIEQAERQLAEAADYQLELIQKFETNSQVLT